MLCRTGDPVCFFLVVYSDVCARIGHCPFNIWSLIYYVPAEVFHVSKQTEMCLSHACRGIGGGPSASRLSRQHASNPMVSTQNPFFRTWLSTVAVWSQLPKQKHFFSIQILHVLTVFPRLVLDKCLAGRSECWVRQRSGSCMEGARLQ
jgi:hypothetical protein